MPTTSPAASSSRASFIPEIEAMRGVAIALVALFHLRSIIRFEHGMAAEKVSVAGAFIGAGHTGVSLFFLLSGFLLAVPFLREAAGGARVDRKVYFARRALRVLPAYWLAVVAASLLVAQDVRDVLRGIPYLLFLNSFPGTTSELWPYSGVWWSLATEAQFYLVLPLLPYFFLSPRGRRIGAIIAALYVVAYVGYAVLPLVDPDERSRYLLVSVIGRAPMFALGAALGWLVGRRGDVVRRRLRETAWLTRGGADLLLVMLLLILGLILQRVVRLGFFVAETGWHVWHLLEAALWAGILALVLLAPLRSLPLISNPASRALGRWSYSLFLIHYPVLWYAVFALKAWHPPIFRAWNLESVVAGAILLAGCVALSALGYRLVERPFLERKARLRLRLEPANAGS